MKNGPFISDPGRILTCNRWSRNPVLYTVELRSLIGTSVRPTFVSAFISLKLVCFNEGTQN